MKVRLTKEEWWPVYDLNDRLDFATPYTPVINISAKLWTEYIEGYNQFQKTQEKLRKLYKKNTE